MRVGRVYIYGDRGKEIHLRVGRVYTLREGRGGTLESWEGVYTERGAIHLRVGRVYTLREGRRYT